MSVFVFRADLEPHHRLGEVASRLPPWQLHVQYINRSIALCATFMNDFGLVVDAFRMNLMLALRQNDLVARGAAVAPVDPPPLVVRAASLVLLCHEGGGYMYTVL